MPHTDYPTMFRVLVRGGDTRQREIERALALTRYRVRGHMAKVLLVMRETATGRDWKQVRAGQGGTEWVRLYLHPLRDGQTVEEVTTDLQAILQGGPDSRAPEMFVATYEGRGAADLADAVTGWHAKGQRRMVLPKRTV